jgi:ABC-type sugar transport system substrate-binding protein
LLFNSDLTEADQELAGKPQQQFKYWLASLMPDDQLAGYLLGKHLIKQAQQKNLTDENGIVQIIAVNGAMISSAAQQRLAGLQKAIAEDDKSNLLRTLDAGWEPETAGYKTERLAQRYPNANVYWVASDAMTIAVEQTLTKKGQIQGKDYLTGG